MLQQWFFSTLKEGDVVLFDKGGGLVCATIFVKRKQNWSCRPSNFTIGEINESRDISIVRVHIERFNERAKRFRWLSKCIHTSEFLTASTKWRVCAFLTIFMGPPVDSTKTHGKAENL